MYDPTAAADAPPPPPPANPSANARYVFLLSKLRNKQITMEEATELFAVQQSMIRAANAAAAANQASPGVAPGSVTSPSPVVGPIGLSDDLVWISLLGIGAGAGLLAAMVKRFQAGPPPVSSPAGPSPRAATSE
jgi:hypothetical protein